MTSADFCPRCQAAGFYLIARDGRRRCKTCRWEWSALSATVFRANKVDPKVYRALVAKLIQAKSGISVRGVHRDLGVAQRSARFIFQKVKIATLGGGEGRCKHTALGEAPQGQLEFRIAACPSCGRVMLSEAKSWKPMKVRVAPKATSREVLAAVTKKMFEPLPVRNAT